LKTGNYSIAVKLGSRFITRISVNIYKPGDLLKPASASLLIKNTLILGEKKFSGIVMKTKFGSNQLDIPYSGKYILTSLKGKVKFCNVSKVRSRTCNYGDLVEDLSFTYDDTYR
jgi:hypothetical protein